MMNKKIRNAGMMLAAVVMIGLVSFTYNGMSNEISEMNSYSLIDAQQNVISYEDSYLGSFEEGKCGEGKCGEGKCGEGKSTKKETKKESKNTKTSKKETKGTSKTKKSETKKGTSTKSKESKCGTGKCGGVE